MGSIGVLYMFCFWQSIAYEVAKWRVGLGVSRCSILQKATMQMARQREVPIRCVLRLGLNLLVFVDFVLWYEFARYHCRGKDVI